MMARGDADFLEAILLDERTGERGILHPDGLRRLLAGYRAGNNRCFHFLHLLAGVELWHRLFIDHNP